jgi:glycine hydroxymethyltransferase
MGKREMQEIASIIKLVLSHTKASVVAAGANAGKPSKANYELDREVAQQARGRVSALLGDFPVYPELDLDFLTKHFG